MRVRPARSILLIAVVFVAAVTSTVSAQNYAGPVIAPGHDTEIIRVLRDEICELEGVEVEARQITAHYDCGDVVLSARVDDCDLRCAGRFELDGPSELTLRLVDRVPRLDGIWSAATRDVHSSIVGDASGGLPGRIVALLLAVFVFVAFAKPVGKAFARLRSEPSALAIAVLSISFFAGAAIGGPWGSLHEHNSFVARTDCAIDMDCAGSQVGWLTTGYALTGALLNLLPGDYPARSAFSLAMSVLALVCALVFIARLHPRFVGAGACSIALVALHPALPRLASAQTLWPLAIALLMIALTLSLEMKTVFDELAAAAAWSLVLTTSVAFLPLAPLALWLALRDRASASVVARRVSIMLAVGLLVASDALPALPPDNGPLVEHIHAALLEQQLFASGVTPLGLTIMVVAGVFATLPTTGARLWILLLLPTTVLGARVDVGYPTAFLHGFPLFFFYGVLASFALVALAERWPRAPVLLTSLVLATYPFARSSIVFAGHSNVLHEELRQLDGAFAQLPDHERLVIPPRLFPREGEFIGDPVEVVFPFTFYRREFPDTMVMTYGDWLESGTPMEGTLVYVGASVQLARPEEAIQLRRPWRDLEPLFAWETVWSTRLDAKQSPMASAQPTEPEVGLRFLMPLRRLR